MSTAKTRYFLVGSAAILTAGLAAGTVAMNTVRRDHSIWSRERSKMRVAADTRDRLALLPAAGNREPATEAVVVVGTPFP